MIAGAASRAAQCFGGIGECGKPSRSGSENNSGDERQAESEGQYDEGWRGADGKEMRAVKGQREKKARGCHCDKKSGYAASDGEQDAFGESLHDNFAPRGTQSQAYCGLSATSDCAGEEQVGHVGAHDQEHQAANGQEDLQAAAVLFFHFGDTGAGGDHVDELLGKHLNHAGHPVGRIAGIILHPLAQDSG